MLILVLINVQYILNVVFSFEKGSNDQNHSSSDSHHPITPPPSKISHLPNLSGYLENPGKLARKLRAYFICEHLNGISIISTGMNDDYNNRIRPESG